MSIFRCSSISLFRILIIPYTVNTRRTMEAVIDLYGVLQEPIIQEMLLCCTFHKMQHFNNFFIVRILLNTITG